MSESNIPSYAVVKHRHNTYIRQPNGTLKKIHVKKVKPEKISNFKDFCRSQIINEIELQNHISTDGNYTWIIVKNPDNSKKDNPLLFYAAKFKTLQEIGTLHINIAWVMGIKRKSDVIGAGELQIKDSMITINPLSGTFMESITKEKQNSIIRDVIELFKKSGINITSTENNLLPSYFETNANEFITTLGPLLNYHNVNKSKPITATVIPTKKANINAKVNDIKRKQKRRTIRAKAKATGKSSKAISR